MIGLTGGIASGKSTVTARLRALGAFVADADEVSRRVVSLPGVAEAIRAEFGDVFAPDGGLDRYALAMRAFSSPHATEILNGITHPAIAEELLRMAREAEESGLYPLVFVDAALLIESGFYKNCSGVWLVTAPESLRIARVMDRDGLTYDEARARIARQASDEEKRAYASVVIENDGSLEELLGKADSAFAAELVNTAPEEIDGDYYDEER